jgi:chromosome partitioning protein
MMGDNTVNFSSRRAHVIVVGNEKGGSGKTTTAVHLVVSLLKLGFTVGCIDADARQRSLSHYMDNRRHTVGRLGTTLPLPVYTAIDRSKQGVVQAAEEEEQREFEEYFTRFVTSQDFVVIDTPGSDTFLSRLAHSHADTVITPINDSFVDLDVLATVDGQSGKIVRPSIYSEMMWRQKMVRAQRDRRETDWIVLRNRLSHTDARNKRAVGEALDALSKRIAFRIAPGFSERVIFRELFLQGLTVLDVMDGDLGIPVSMSHVAARQEIRELLRMLGLPQINTRLDAAPVSAETGLSATA